MKAKLHYPFGKPPEGVDAVWRCEARQYSYIVDAEREEYGVTDPRLELCWYHVERRTPKGAWSCGGFHLLSAKRCQFRNTPEEAVTSFIKRRERQIAILKGQLQRAERELSLATREGLFA